MRLGYARVSTASGEQLAALEGQRQRLADAGVDEIIQDIQSGRDTDRIGYLDLLDRIDRRQVEEVVITRVDRLGRDAADTDAAIAFAAKRGVRLTALDGGEIESTTPAGFVMSRTLTTMAQMESMMLSMRINAALEASRRQGKPLRGRAPWGYAITPDKRRFECHAVEWRRARDFVDLLRANNWRMNTSLDRWQRDGRGEIPLHSDRAVRAWLLNPVLRGATGYQQTSNHQFRQIVWDTQPSLLVPGEFEEFQEVMSRNRAIWGHAYGRKLRLLTGLCVCASCGKRMVYAPGRRIASMLCHQRGCELKYKSLHETKIRDRANEVLSSHALALANQVDDEPDEAKELRAQIKALEAMNDPDLAGVLQSKNARLDSLLYKDKVDMQLLHKVQRPCFWQHYHYQELVEVYHELIRRIVIRVPRVEEVVLLRF